MNLYEVGHQGAELERLLTESEGELTPELEAQLDAFLQGGKAKVEAAAKVLKNLQAYEDACKLEAQRLNARAQSFAKSAESLKARLLFAVDMGFDGKVKTELFTIWGQTSAPSVNFSLAADADLETLAHEMPDLVRTQYDLDRIALRESYKAGTLPAAFNAEEKPGTRYVRVK